MEAAEALENLFGKLILKLSVQIAAEENTATGGAIGTEGTTVVPLVRTAAVGGGRG